MRSEEREAMRQQKAAERDELRKLPDAFKLNLGANPDRFYDIIMGNYRPPTIEGENPKITAPINSDKYATQVRKLRGQDVEEESGGEENVIRAAGVPRPTKVNTKFAAVIQELERFEFSEDPEKLASQFEVVNQSIRNALQRLRLQEVAANTRTAYGKYVQKVEPAPGGLKVYFDFGSGPIAVTAQGSFFGDETICVYAVDGSARAAVMKIANGQKGVLEGFNVSMQKVGAK